MELMYDDGLVMSPQTRDFLGNMSRALRKTLKQKREINIGIKLIIKKLDSETYFVRQEHEPDITVEA